MSGNNVSPEREDTRYREATVADVSALARIREQGGWVGGAPATRMLGYLERTHHPSQALRPRVMFVALRGESPIGFIAGHLTRRYQCDGELQWIFVDPQHRGSGVASELLRLLADWFRRQEAPRVCVDVDPSNVPARRFYARHGAEALNPHWMVWNDIGGVP